jgi:hypothetical protein
LQPFAVGIELADLLIGIILCGELIMQGKRRLWLLLGIIPAFYSPAIIVFAFLVACPLGWTSCDF